uniref:Putative secreted protein n=1 Tax=Anopheles darlingi TaxID=43151 RepID=A0A2M4DR30_ANODA
MPVVMSYDLVVLEIPALHLAILTAAEQIRMTGTYGESPNCTDVSRERQFQLSAGEVPYFNHSIGSTRREPFVAGFDCHAPNPSQMTGNDAAKFPRSVPFRLRNGWRFLGQYLHGIRGILGRRCSCRNECVRLRVGAIRGSTFLFASGCYG